MVKVGIIGLGEMGKIHVDLAKKSGKIDIIGGCEIDSKRIDDIKDIYNFDIYSDLDKFLSNEEIEYVIISTPNRTHEEVAIKALSYKKNVLIDKPLSIDYESSLRIFNKALENRKKVLVFQSRRWDADFLKIKEIIDSGILGDILGIQSRLYEKIWEDREIDDIQKSWRLNDAGGGLLLDWGAHLIDQILLLIKRDPVSIYGLLQKSSLDYIIDDYFLGIFEFDNNIICEVEARNNDRLKMPRWYIVGTKGSLIVKNKKNYIWDEIEIEYKNNKGKEVREIIKIPNVKIFSENIYKDFEKFVNGEKEVFVDINESLRVLKIIDLIRFSNKEKKIFTSKDLKIHQ